MNKIIRTLEKVTLYGVVGMIGVLLFIAMYQGLVLNGFKALD